MSSGTTSPGCPRKSDDGPTTGKTRQGRNGISGFVQHILSSKKKPSNLKRGSNLPTMRLQATDLPARKASPLSQPLSEQNVECMVYYEPHDLNASLSSGSDKGSHAGSGSGSGSSSHVIKRKNKLANENVSSQKDIYSSRYPTRKLGTTGTATSTSTAIPESQLTTNSKPSLYAHGDYGSVSHGSTNYGYATQPQSSVQSGPAYTNVRPSNKNSSTGNYLPMDQYLYKDSSGVSSSVSGSFRQEETSLGLEDSGIDTGAANCVQQTGYVGSRASAYSQDDYLLPLSRRDGNYGTEEQLKLQQLQLQRQEQQLQMLQEQHYQIQQQILLQHQQTHRNTMQPNLHSEQPPHSEQLPTELKSGSKVYQDGSVKSSLLCDKGKNARNVITEGSGLSIRHNHASIFSNTAQTHTNETPSKSNGKYGRKNIVKHKTTETMGKPVLNQSSCVTVKQEKQILSSTNNTKNIENSAVHNTSSYETKTKPMQYGRKHTFAPQEGYTEVASRSSVRSSRSSSSKGSSSQGRADLNRPVAANIILNIPGYRVSGSLGRNKRLSSAEESDMESMTSVSVTSREVANIMTQAMRMQRNSSRRKSKGQCEHHYRTFTTKPGKGGNLSRSSHLRSSNSSNKSKGKRACARCGSQNQKPEKSGESLISFIEQSMRSFLLNSSETVSTEDNSPETKSSSERNKTPSEGSPGNALEPAHKDSSPPNSWKATSSQVSSAPSLFEIASYCDLHTIEIQNDYSNSLGYGMHLQQVNFKPEGFIQTSGILSNNGVHLGQGSSAFHRFQGRTRLIYCIHMLDKAGIAAKNGALKEGDYLIEVNGVNCLEKSDEALLEVLSQETDSLKLLVARGHHKEPQEFFA